MRKLIPAFAVLVFACGGPPKPPPFIPATTCRASGFGLVFLQDVRPCACPVKTLERAQQEIRARGIAAPSEEFSGLEFYFRASDSIWDWGDGTLVDGLYESDGNWAEVSRLGSQALHEMIHYLEINLRGVDLGYSYRHPGWADKGYFAATRAFAEETDPSYLAGAIPCDDANP